MEFYEIKDIPEFVSPSELYLLAADRAKRGCKHEARFIIRTDNGDVCALCELQASAEREAALAKALEIAKGEK